MTHSKLSLYVLAIAAVSAITSSASALTTINLPFAGGAMIGRFEGRTGVMVDPGSGFPNCVTILFPTDAQNRLSDNIVINGTNNGAAGTGDWIATNATDGQFHCGVDFHPIIMNGFNMTINAGSSNDIIQNATIVNVTGNGGTHNDFMLNFTSNTNARSNGNDGNDVFFGSSGDFMDGGNGDDTFCINAGETANTVTGGFGDDDLCGATLNQSGLNSPFSRCPC